jgi:hypothetical protein
MFALTLCGLLFGCGGLPEDGEPTQAPEVTEPDTQVTPEAGEFLEAHEAPEPDTQGTPTEGAEGTVSAATVWENSYPGSFVRFNSVGDNFYVSDTLRDGRLAVAQIKNLNTGQYYYCANRYGAGTTAFCNLDFVEGHWLIFRACTSEEGFLRAACNPNWTGANSAN